MNTRNIEPVEFWTPEGNKSAGEILLYNFHGYNFDGTDSIVSYKIGNTDEGGKWTSLSEGSVFLPDDIVQAWGEDDEPIFDYVIAELNLTEIV